jgi:cell division protein FtsZ
VAILGSAQAEGEDRAQKAIEEALNSPLLNDSDIRGAKWVLVNINSGIAEQECTMDEFEVINNFLRAQSGDNTDLIIGTGYDTTLGNKIGITLIATGFEYKDPFTRKAAPVAEKKAPVEEKIVMTLGIDGEEKKLYNQQPLPFVEKDPFAPKLVEEQEEQKVATPVFFSQPRAEEPAQEEVKTTDEPMRFELLLPREEPVQKIEPLKAEAAPEQEIKYVEKEIPVQPKVSTGFLSKPKNIYADGPALAPQHPVANGHPVVQQPELQPVINAEQQQSFMQQEVQPKAEEPKMFLKEEPSPEENVDFKLVIKEDEPAKKQPVITVDSSLDDLLNNEEEEQKRRAAERISKLRNLSFNMNAADSNAEYDNVPAYVRRNMELFGNTLTSVEQFYSKYTVKKDENDETQISTINTFLDGKKPD